MKEFQFLQILVDNYLLKLKFQGLVMLLVHLDFKIFKILPLSIAFILLLQKKSVFKRSIKGKFSTLRNSLSDRSIVSNWFFVLFHEKLTFVDPRFSIREILLPRN